MDKNQTKNQIYNLFCFIGTIILEEDNVYLLDPTYLQEKLDKYIGVDLKSEWIWGCSIKEWNKYNKKWKVSKNVIKLQNLLSFLLLSEPPIGLRELDSKWESNTGNLRELRSRFHPEKTIKLFNKYFDGNENDISNSNYYELGTHKVIYEEVKEYINFYDRYLKLLTL